MPIPRIPFTFIMAPHYHPSLASIAPYRKALPFLTMFNILGPLINPARPRGMVLGVAEPEIGPTFAQCLGEGGVERALVVCGYERVDEISCAGPTHVWELRDGQVTKTVFKPEHFGLPCHPLQTVVGGTPAENAATFKTLLTSGDMVPEQLVPVLDFVLMNASALLVVAGIADDYIEGTKLARESIISGKAWKALETFREAGKKVAQV
jgi:anthranilate phosphoribosyltransferase